MITNFKTAIISFGILFCLIRMAFGQETKLIASFEKPSSAREWFSVNDNVMGGVSDGSFRRTRRKTLLFTGDISLENNGGFASIRSKPRDLDLAGATGISVKVRGDGRTYWVGLRTDRQFGASSYRAFLRTTRGKFTETVIPIADFKPQRYGRTLRGGPVDPAEVSSIGFTIADKKSGPFRLELKHVKAVFADEEPGLDNGSGTIVAVASEAGTFKTLLAAATAAGLADVLAGEGPFTVFAPTDKAFANLPKGTVTNLLKEENKQQLVDVLKYHVLAGRINLSKALAVSAATTLQGEQVNVAFRDGRVRIGPATLVQSDIRASNGIIHVIDQVLLPSTKVSKGLTPKALIELAIERGVPLFNNGQPEACAAIYEITCEALRTMAGVSDKSRKDLGRALAKMRRAITHSRKAWILRYALDRVLASNIQSD